MLRVQAGVLFTKAGWRWVCVHLHKYTHTHSHRETAVRKAVSVAISFSPTQTQQGLYVQPVALIPEQIHLRDGCHPTNSHTHTHKAKTNDFSTSGTNRSISPCSKQFSVQQASERKRGRTGRSERSGKKTGRELVFSSCLENNDTPGESIATRRACLFTVKMVLALMSYKRWRKSSAESPPHNHNVAW